MSGSSNFLQFDSTAANIMNDSDYSASTYRTGGVVGGIAPSATHNKMYYQWSTMCSAIGTVLSNAGQTVADNNLAGLITSLGAVFIPAIIGITTKTAGFTAHTADINKFFLCNTTSFTVTFDASATLGAGWFCRIKNNATLGSGINITVTPGSGTINGVASIILGPGSNIIVACDGTNLQTSGHIIFESAQQTITLGGQLVLAHGLGVEPLMDQMYIVCTTAEQGYSIGDKAWLNGYDTNASGSGISVVNDGTNVTLRYPPTQLEIANKSTGVVGAITPADWKFIMRSIA